jgi:hypothetical protein
MIERVYFVSAIVKNKGEVRLHFHSNIHHTSWFPKVITTDMLVTGIERNMLDMLPGDDVLITSFSRIK